MVWAPVGTGDFDHAIYSISNPSARLVAGGTQIALAAVEGRAFESIELYRPIDLGQGPVGTGVCGMDLVAGAAVLAG